MPKLELDIMLFLNLLGSDMSESSVKKEEISQEELAQELVTDATKQASSGKEEKESSSVCCGSCS